MSEPLVETKEKFYNVTFDSVSDIVDTVKKLPRNRYTDDIRYQYDFIGRRFQDIGQACDAIQELWPEGMRTYEQIINQLHDENILPPRSLKRRGAWSEDDGSEINIDRLQEGNPYFRTTKREHRPGPVSVTILSSIATTWDIDSKDIIYRGAAAVCMTELLEKAGYRVELWNVHYGLQGYDNGFGILVGTCLKRGNEPMDVSTLININSGWAFRTVWLASFYYPNQNVKKGHSLPMPIAKTVEHITSDQQVVVCDNIWSHSQAVTWIRNELANFK